MNKEELKKIGEKLYIDNLPKNRKKDEKEIERAKKTFSNKFEQRYEKDPERLEKMLLARQKRSELKHRIKVGAALATTTLLVGVAATTGAKTENQIQDKRPAVETMQDNNKKEEMTAEKMATEINELIVKQYNEKYKTNYTAQQVEHHISHAQTVNEGLEVYHPGVSVDENGNSVESNTIYTLTVDGQHVDTCNTNGEQVKDYRIKDEAKTGVISEFAELITREDEYTNELQRGNQKEIDKALENYQECKSNIETKQIEMLTRDDEER